MKSNQFKQNQSKSNTIRSNHNQNEIKSKWPLGKNKKESKHNKTNYKANHITDVICTNDQKQIKIKSKPNRNGQKSKQNTEGARPPV